MASTASPPRDHVDATARAGVARGGLRVDLRRSTTLTAGVDAHRAEFTPDEIHVTEPNSWDGRQLVERLGCTIVRSNQFLCHRNDFAAWADGRKRLTLEDFYRQQRRHLSYLMDGDEPTTGRWNYDDQNRERPPRSAPSPGPTR